MKILTLGANQKQVIDEAIQTLKQGGLIVAPSDTVYGLVVDTANEDAVKKLINFKNRPLGKSISVFVGDLTMASRYVDINSMQSTILHKLLPGPFTVVLPSLHQTSRLLESEKGTLGIRVPSYTFITDFVTQFGQPLTATSVNLGGRSPHYSIESLLHQLPQSKKDMIDLVIDAGKLPRNKPSTVIDLSTPTVKILRKGDILYSDETTYISHTPTQTKKIAQFIFNKVAESIKPLVFILKGELGTGKTVFVKGIGELLGIKNIISPTFTISYEYPIKNHHKFRNLYHFDLYNIEEAEEFKYLGFEKVLKQGNIVCIEWGEKAGELAQIFSDKAQVIFIEFQYQSPKTRSIQLTL